MSATNDSGEEEASFDVKVYVYDLSGGLAAIYSPMMLGITIPAIYHTSVVVYGKEYFINHGIQVSNSPGTTKYGTPIKMLDMGSTYVTPDIFEDFLEELRNHEGRKYSAESYDLFDNNCNHFSDVVVDFLVGKRLDPEILELPKQVLNTPGGQALRQMIGTGDLM